MGAKVPSPTPATRPNILETYFRAHLALTRTVSNVVRSFDDIEPGEDALVSGAVLPEDLIDADDDEFEEFDLDDTVADIPIPSPGQAAGTGRDLSALSSFQRSADRFPPLTPAQQLELTKVYRAGIEARYTLASNKPGKKEKEILLDAVTKGDRAMEHLCASCWRLAWLIVREQAQRRFGRDKATDLLPDLMGEANGALVQAVRDFDPEKTPSFHTYAAQVVRNHTRMVLGRDGYLKLAPAWVRIKRISAARIPELTTELGRVPTKEELQNSLLEYCLVWANDKLTEEQQELPEPQRQELRMAKLRKQGMLGAIRDIDDVLVAAQTPVSLDAPVGADGSATLGDLIPGAGDSELFDHIELKDLRRVIGESLAALNERERDVIIRRFGLDGAEPSTCAQLGEVYGVSSERIRQVERAALAKLASPHGQFAGLASFLPSKEAYGE